MYMMLKFAQDPKLVDRIADHNSTTTRGLRQAGKPPARLVRFMARMEPVPH